MNRTAFLDRRRAECWQLGVRHRESLLQRYMDQYQIVERPLLKDVIDDIIRDVQEARLYCAALPLDTFGQTEARRGRIEVTINSRISEMPGVKDAAGVAYRTKWHESIHVTDDVSADSDQAANRPLFLPGFEEDTPRLIVCRKNRSTNGGGAEAAREFTAEHASLAAAIADEDLARSQAFQEFQHLIAEGGELPNWGWRLLYESAEFIGINPTALVDYLQQRGLFHITPRNGKKRLVANPSLGVTLCL
ncbi:MAG: hypothetical protein HY689_02135 [Chloroflexi bacterium]|nr:hypothetical protein [Chloroflexota bacterium]